MFPSILTPSFDARNIISAPLSNCPIHHSQPNASEIQSSLDLKESSSYQRHMAHTVFVFRDMNEPSFDMNRITFENLDVCRIPTPAWNTVCAQRSIDLANLSVMLVIGLVGKVSDPRIYRNQTLQNKLRDSWPAVWAWMQFFLLNVVEDDGGTMRPIVRVREGLGHLVFGYASTPHLRGALVHTPQFLYTYTRQWLDEERCGTGGKASTVDEPLTRGLGQFFQIGFDDIPFHEALQATNGQKPLALAAVGRLQAYLDQESLSMDGLLVFFGLVMHLASPRLSPMQDDTLAAGSTRQVIRCLAKLNKNPTVDRSGQLAVTCMLLLSDAFKHPVRGPECLLQAIEGGLFPELHASMRFVRMHPGFKDSASYNLIDNMRMWLLDPHVIGIVGAALDQATYLRGPLGSPWQQQWSAFLELLRQRQFAKEMSDRVSFQCMFCDRDYSSQKEILKECTGCHGARYCSQSCQHKDWAKGHKTLCKQIRKRRDEAGLVPGGLTGKAFLWSILSCAVLTPFTFAVDTGYRHKKFAVTAAKVEMGNRWEEVAAKLAPFSRVPRKALILEVDFTTLPPPLKITYRPGMAGARLPDGATHVVDYSDMLELGIMVAFPWMGNTVMIWE